MPVSSRDLYYQLAIRADDDGFIQPRLVMKTIGSTDDDLTVLLGKRFLLTFESGVVVVKHWLIHNMIRSDRYKPTRFQEEKSALYLKDNKAYTLTTPVGLHSGNQMAPQVRLGKVRKDTAKPSASTGFTVEEEKPRKPQEPKNTSKRYQELVEWLRDLTGAPMPVLGKQYAALKRAREADISVTRLKDRAEELMTDSFYRDKGFDWADVVSSFNKRA